MCIKTEDFLYLISIINNIYFSLKIPREQKGVTTVSAYNKPLFLLELETCTCSFDYPEGIRWNDAELDIIVKENLDAWNNDISLLSEREKENIEDSELFARLFDKYKFVDNILSQVIISNNLDPTKHNGLQNLLVEFGKYAKSRTSTSNNRIIKETIFEY